VILIALFSPSQLPTAADPRPLRKFPLRFYLRMLAAAPALNNTSISRLLIMKRVLVYEDWTALIVADVGLKEPWPAAILNSPSVRIAHRRWIVDDGHELKLK